VTVEFSLILLPFFAILFAIIDYAQIYFYENSLQNGLREATRFATAGRVIQQYVGGVPQYTNVNGFPAPLAVYDSAGRPASRNECIRWWFQSNCILNVPLTDIVVTSAPSLGYTSPTLLTNNYGNLILLQVGGAAAVRGPGAEGDYVQVAVTNYTLHAITPLFGWLGGWSRVGFSTYQVYRSAISKNEPALLNFQQTNLYSDEPWPSP
jgi:hypothetical protein